MVSAIASQSKIGQLLCQEVVNIINEGLIVKSLDGSTVKVNDQALAITGLKREDFEDANLPELVKRFYKTDMTGFSFDELPSIITKRSGEPTKNIVFGIRANDKMAWLSASSKIIEFTGERFIIISFFDISELIESNRRLAEKEDHLKTIVASLDDIVFELSADGVYLNYWTRDEGLMFIPPEKFLGKSLRDLFPEQECDVYMELIGKTLSTGESQILEYRSILSGDNDSWYQMRINPISGASGRVTINISDITTQKKMKMKLAEMEELWRFAVEGSGLGMWIWDVTTNQVSLSEKWLKMHGYGEEEMMGTVEFWAEKVHPDDVGKLIAAFDRQIAGETQNFSHEYRLMNNAGNYRWVLSKGMMERSEDGKPLRMIGTHTDVTDRAEALKKVSISEQKFHNAFHFSGIGMALVDLDGKCMEVNATLSEILGYSSEEFCNMRFPEYSHNDDVEKDSAQMRMLVAGLIEHYKIEKRYLHKSGYYVWCLLTVSLVKDNDNRPVFAIAQVQDITAIKSLIGKLEKQNANLELTTLDLEQKINQLEDFNQIVAHNLRGPAGNIEMLLDAIESAVDEEEKSSLLELLKSCSGAMQQTLGELMEILEIRLNKVLPAEWSCFCNILKNTMTQYNAIIIQKKAIIDANFEMGAIRYPKIYLDSIFHNLISNALKYSSEERQPKIYIRSYTKDGSVFLSVSDNGLGIDLAKYGNQIFKFRKIFHPNHDSRGVGLFMIRNQVETMGGTISVTSEPGIGSTFLIKF